MPRRRPGVRILAVTQLPPPVHGQSVAGRSFVEGRYSRIEVLPVRMAFSSGTDEVGKPGLGKLVHLFGLIARILWTRARTGADVLYYPPAGPNLVPVLRDLVILVCTRWAFRATVFHFHAAGLSEIEPRLPRPLRGVFRIAYGKPDLAIQTSSLNPPDGARIGARRIVVVANGVPDQPLAERPRPARADGPPTVLYVGMLRESKGLLVLAEAARLLRENGRDFHLQFVGAFESRAFEQRLRGAIQAAGLSAQTTFTGVLRGEEKARAFLASDVFCYATHFEAESFGIATVEAMQFSLPVVATRWRGLPSVVAEGESGLLVPVENPSALADALAAILEDAELRLRMGARGRALYLERFTEERFHQNMEAVLADLRERPRPATSVPG